MVRVRFAPSPTGYLHIGGARTALFNYLYARREGGQFILRIEDTDVERSKKEFLNEIFDSLTWLGMDWDEIYYQSERLGLYREHAERLLAQGKAYYSEEKDDAGRAAVKFKVIPEVVKISDMVYGEITFDNSLLKDFVLLRSNGIATYNFACVVDDTELKITHVIRGADHISNTPKQVALYRALGIKPPKFAHIPLTMGTDGKRLSKRHGATSISDFRRMGYLPEALTNFIALLSWSPGGNRELLTKEEMIAEFSPKRIKKTPGIFDNEKLDWINGHYIRKADPRRVLDLVIPSLKKAGYISDNFDADWLLSVVKLFQPRLKTISEFPNLASFIFLDEVRCDPDAKKEFLAEPETLKNLALLTERLEALPDFAPGGTERVFRALSEELAIKAAEIIHPARVALTGRSESPGLFEVMALLGKERSLSRLRKALATQ
jgi:glutamyl-tRNA synthetase